MIIMYAVISYDPHTEQEISIAGWSANESEARELESRMNDIAESYAGNASPLIEYSTVALTLYGCTAEYRPYGDFDALIRDGLFYAIVPAGQGEHYLCLLEGADVVHCMNILKGFDSYPTQRDAFHAARAYIMEGVK